MTSRLSTLPPALHYRLGHNRTLAYVVAFALSALLVLWIFSLWQWRNQVVIWWPALGFVLVYMWLAYVAWQWQQQLPIGWLVWTGVHWQLQTTSIQERVKNTPSYKSCACILDVQSALLLRLTICTHKSPAPQARWVWVQAASSPQHWCALRAVVYAQKNQ